ncbi:MAG: AI-2E family transporter [Lachnospiraceae bacterium]|nr:AI-2E family transporter [Lachnospiraceae bacterium]
MHDSHSRPYTFDRVVRILATIAVIAAAIWLINLLRNVLLPFVVACLVAYLLDPLVELNRKLLRMKGRGLASLLTLVEVTSIIALLGYFFVPSIIKEVNQLEALVKQSSQGSPIPFIPEDIATPIRKWVSDFNVKNIMQNSHFMSLLNSGSSFISATVDFLLHTLEWLLTFIYIIFILIDYPTLMTGFRKLVPIKYRSGVYRVEDEIKDSMNRYFRSQALIALCAAVFYCIGFSIVGIPLAIILGITVGVLYMIPYFQYVTLIPVAIVCLIDSGTGDVHFWQELGECLIVYAVSQCICDYILTPKIMGKSLGLNPAIILLSLSVWGTLMGIIGMIIALPATALLLDYYRRYIIGDEPSSIESKVRKDSSAS